MKKEIDVSELNELIYSVVKDSVETMQQARLGQIIMMLDYMPRDISEVVIEELYEKLDFDYIESIEIIGGKDEI